MTASIAITATAAIIIASLATIISIIATGAASEATHRSFCQPGPSKFEDA